jgi:putative sterol carrier protein
MVTREQIDQIFSAMAERFDGSKLSGLDAAIQFDLQGDNGGLYWLKIANGGLDVGSGAVDAPKMTLTATTDDFYSMMTGSLNPMQGFMLGKIKIKGDTGLAMKLMPLLNSGT